MPLKNFKNCIARAAFMALALYACLFSNAFGESKKDTDKINKFKGMDYKKVIKKIRTPKEAEWYVRHYIIQDEKESDVAKSFKLIHETRTGDCSEGAVAAAALLSDNGYRPRWLFLKDSAGKIDNHGVFLYEENGKWATIGINDKDNGKGYDSLEEIAQNLGYDTCELKELDQPWLGGWTRWIDSSRDLYGSGKMLAGKK